MIDFALDNDTHDLLIEGNNLKTVEGVEQVEQNTKIRLKFFSEEWFLDTTKGLPFYQEILIKNPNVPNIDNIIKATIADTLGVGELLSYDSTYDSTAREYVVKFQYRTDDGLSTVQVTL